MVKAPDSAEDVLILGAGMAGLLTALALSSTGRNILLLDRDGPPPEGDADAVFEDWRRRGEGQFRHSHAFLAPLRRALEAHPALMAQLREAGCRETPFAELVPSTLRAAYSPQPGDGALGILSARRSTLEWVLRRYVERQPNVRIQSGAFVSGWLAEADEGGPPRVTGLTGEADGAPVEWRAAVVVDAAGCTSRAFEWLAEAGVTVTQTEEEAGILYFTRHYHLRPGVAEPSRAEAPPATGDLGFIKYGLFRGDGDWFSITLAVPEIEAELRAAVVRPETFQQICALLPGIARWTDPAHAEPMTKVFGMGELKSHWRSLLAGGRPLALGLFVVGDALIRTNPLYGKGCSFAAVEAEALRGALEGSADPARRIARYQVRVDAALRPFYEDMLNQDRAAIRRAARARDPDYRPDLTARLVGSFARDGVGVALRRDIETLRAALRAFQMLAPPNAWLSEPQHIGPVLASWGRGRRRNAAYYTSKLGPSREAFLQELGVAQTP